jgi:16S rRNA (cytosine967-C5)-methyltransferase
VSGEPRSPARKVAFSVVRRTFEDGAYSDRVLASEAGRARLDPRDRALATLLAYGTVQRRATVDHVIATYVERPLDRIEPGALAALRLGTYELTFREHAAAHAVVTDAVELAKGASQGGAGLVNAVLRRVADDGRERVATVLADDADPQSAALAHSHPLWIAKRWWSELGAADARALLEANNEAAEHALRINTLVADPAKVAAHLREGGVELRPAGGIPEGIVIEGRFDAHGSSLFAEGALVPQSRAAMAVAHIVDPQPGERVLDLCAAPGGKATHLAALMGGEGEVVAVEKNPKRADTLRRVASRLHADIVRVVIGDARERVGEGFDRVLVDPPCSGLGTLRSRPDLRWRVREAHVSELAQLQLELLHSAADQLRPGGTLVYSTCTISRSENDAVVDALLSGRDDLEPHPVHADHPLWEHGTGERLQLMPHRDGTDGFFIARLRRREATA